MKSPDEIKKGLECCYGNEERRYCEKCPFGMKTDGIYPTFVCTNFDAVGEGSLAYIQRLEAERDALLNIVRQYGECEICLHRVTDDTDCEEACYMCDECNKEECVCCGCTTTNSHWDWEGIKEDNQ